MAIHATSQLNNSPITIKHQNKTENKNEKRDPLKEYPLRFNAYTNEIGAALSPIPKIGNTIFKLSWIPALLYMGADIYDKYAKGSENDYSKSSRSQAVKQAVFQGLASVLLPTAAVMVGQNLSADMSRFISKDKMDIRAKEEVLTELKRSVNQDKIRGFRDKIDEILTKNPTLSIDEIKQNEAIKQIKDQILNDITKEIKAESASAKIHNQQKNLFQKIIRIFSSSSIDCEHIAKMKDGQIDSVMKSYLQKQLNNLIDKRIELQSAINRDGTLSNRAKNLDEKTFKKITKLLELNEKNRDVQYKASHVIKECILGELDKTAMKLSGIKVIGGFISLAALAIPIDIFVEKVIIHKVVEPGLKEVKEKLQKDKTQ